MGGVSRHSGQHALPGLPEIRKEMLAGTRLLGPASFPYCDCIALDLVQPRIAGTCLRVNANTRIYQTRVVLATGVLLPTPALAFATDSPADSGPVVYCLKMKR